jgi:hypothetical protein
MGTPIRNYLDRHEHTIVEELTGWVRIRSVAGAPPRRALYGACVVPRRTACLTVYAVLSGA